MVKSSIFKVLQEELGSNKIKKNESLSQHTSFRIGGDAEFFCSANTNEELIKVLSLIKRYQIPFAIIGNGTNILFSDKGIEGIVVRLSKKEKMDIKDDLIFCGSRNSLSSFMNFAMVNNYGGLEFLEGIPGTVGGAIFMNAGSSINSISTCLSSILVIDKNLEYQTRLHKEVSFNYRFSDFQLNGDIILGAWFNLPHDDAKKIAITRKDIREHKIKTQSWEFPSAGCIFRNPPATAAGKIIEESGCKGLMVGGAQVSEKHANFIVNRKDATGDDVVKLIIAVQKKVYEKFNIKLKPEIRFVGEFKGIEEMYR